jgi:HEAT repeats
MPGWLGPRCPLETGEKMWTEYRMRWLAGKLGFDRLVGSEVILPIPQYFPDPYTGTPADVWRIFDRVCGYMKLDPAPFDLEVVPDDFIRGAVGLYSQAERPRIVLARAQLSDPERLVATIAHELAHHILLGGGLLTGQEEDHEQLTDLLPVFLGLGLFAANSPVRDRNFSDNGMHYFKIDKQGYLPSRIFGYGLALFAYARGETRPAWSSHLRLDALGPLKQGLRYLLKTGDSLFGPDTAHPPADPPSESEMIKRLSSGSPTVRAMTLSEISALDPPPVGLIDVVAERLRDRDVHVRIEAARTLPLFGDAARGAVSDLFRCLSSGSAELRAHAMTALPLIGAPLAQVVPELTRHLQDSDKTVADTAAYGLGRLGSAAASAVPFLVEAIRISEVHCSSSEYLADALIAIAPPADVLQRLLDSIEPEIRELVIQSLQVAQTRRMEEADGAHSA